MSRESFRSRLKSSVNLAKNESAQERYNKVDYLILIYFSYFFLANNSFLCTEHMAPTSTFGITAAA